MSREPSKRLSSKRPAKIFEESDDDDSREDIAPRNSKKKKARVSPDEEEEEEKVNTQDYYKEWSGHTIKYLALVHRQLVAQNKKRFVWLAGDSSLDNKRWLFSHEGGELPSRYQIPAKQLVKAVNGYEQILSPSPAMSMPDVCHWINFELAGTGKGEATAAIMTSVEESLLRARKDGLLNQDEFIRDNMGQDDILIVSVGGNDVALSPTDEVRRLMTSLGMRAIKGQFPTLAELQPLVDLLKTDLEAYIVKLTKKHKPALVLVCAIYFPCEVQGPSWAQKFFLAYDQSPAFFQQLIRTLFQEATKKVRVPGCKSVVPVPLFEVLDPKYATQYIQRVEPSSEGGHLMAKRFVAEILKHDRAMASSSSSSAKAN